MPAGRIRELSDAFRTTLLGGRVLVTRGVLARGQTSAEQAIAAVKAFDAFTPENDPYSEHDFGSFTVEGTRLCFKIDYYDAEERFGSPDPADPSETACILTLLLPDAY